MSDDPLEIVTIPVTLICRTPGCGNVDHPIDVDAPPGAYALCGACGVQITDVVQR